MISVKNITLKYPNNKGIFDLDFNISQGEAVGYLGPNGAGKTTTIRNLLGFVRPESGKCLINDLDCFDNTVLIQKFLGYIPGEISFFDDMKGNEFLDFMCAMRKTKDYKLKNNLIDRFELDINGKIKKYSKGMKQKLGIIAAFMHNPTVLILDEPTSGLDPLMQNRFIDLVLEEKKNGKTILMSSHMFDEIEKSCDNVIIIKEGRIVAKNDIATLKASQRKGFRITTDKQEIVINHPNIEVEKIGEYTYTIFLTAENINYFIKEISKVSIINIDSLSQGLEDIFLNYYKKGE